MTHSTHSELISKLSALTVCILLAVPGVAGATELDCVGIGTCMTPADDGTMLGDSESNTAVDAGTTATDDNTTATGSAAQATGIESTAISVNGIADQWGKDGSR